MGSHPWCKSRGDTNKTLEVKEGLETETKEEAVTFVRSHSELKSGGQGMEKILADLEQC